MAWTAGARWTVQVGSWIATVFIARILSPEDYGIVGMATVYIGLTGMVTEFGVSSAIVALRSLSPAQISQLNTLAVLLGVAATLLSLLMAVPISWFFRSPAVALVIVVLSATLFIDSLRSVPAAVLAKDMRFKFLAFVEAGKGLFVAAITIGLAFSGFGYWALVAGIVLTSIVTTGLVLAKSRLPFERPRRRDLTEPIDYTRHFLISNISWYVYSNADFAVAGRILGKVPLGEYTYAWSVANAPIEKVAAVINRVLPPLYSSVSGDKAALRRYVLKLSHVFAMLVMPVATGLSLVAGDFIPLLLGRKWVGAVAPLRILAFYSLLQCLTLLITPVLTVTGRVRIASSLGVVAAVLLPIAFAIGGAIKGTVGIAMVWITVYPLIILIIYRIVFRAIELGWREYAKALLPGSVACVTMAATVMVISSLMSGSGDFLRLVMKVGGGALVYLIVLYLGWRESLSATMETVRSLK